MTENITLTSNSTINIKLTTVQNKSISFNIYCYFDTVCFNTNWTYEIERYHKDNLNYNFIKQKYIKYLTSYIESSTNTEQRKTINRNLGYNPNYDMMIIIPPDVLANEFYEYQFYARPHNELYFSKCNSLESLLLRYCDKYCIPLEPYIKYQTYEKEMIKEVIKEIITTKEVEVIKEIYKYVDLKIENCCICTLKQSNCIGLCGHIVTCNECSIKINKCPTCRKDGQPFKIFI